MKMKNNNKIRNLDYNSQKKIQKIPSINLETMNEEYLKNLQTRQYNQLHNQLTKIVDMLMEQEFMIDREIKNQRNKQQQRNENLISQYSSVNSQDLSHYYSQGPKPLEPSRIQNTLFDESQYFSGKHSSLRENNLNLSQKKNRVFQQNEEEENNQQEQKECDVLDKLINKIQNEKDKVQKQLEKEKKNRLQLEKIKSMNQQNNICFDDYSENLMIKDEQIKALSNEVNQLRHENQNLKSSIQQLKKNKTEINPDKENAFSYIMKFCEIQNSFENQLTFTWVFDNQQDLCKLLQTSVCLQAERENKNETEHIESFYQSIMQSDNFEDFMENQVTNSNKKNKTSVKQQKIDINELNDYHKNNNLQINKFYKEEFYYKDDMTPTTDDSSYCKGSEEQFGENQLVVDKLKEIQSENEKDKLIDSLRLQIEETIQQFEGERNKFQDDMKYMKRQQRELEIQQNLLKLERERFVQEMQEKSQLDELERMKNELSLLQNF